MKLTIKKNTDVYVPHYVLNINFMEGDADGWPVESMTFQEGEEEDIKRIIMAVARCSAAYPRGRGGDDEYNGLLEYDAFFNEETFNAHWDVCVEYDYDLADLERINPNKICINHPTDSIGISTSFEGFDLFFYDESRVKNKVKVTFTKEEKAYIAEAAKILR